MSSVCAGESKYSTCPARFGGRSSLKRDSNQISLWELQEAMLTDSTADAMLESSSQVAPSRLSGTSAHSGDYGSWPRSRKQRTDAGSPRRSVVSMWAADADASLAPLASANPAPLAPASRAATSEAVAASGSVAQLDAMCLAAHEPDEASEGIALAALEEMARELKAEAEVRPNRPHPNPNPNPTPSLTLAQTLALTLTLTRPTQGRSPDPKSWRPSPPERRRWRRWRRWAAGRRRRSLRRRSARRQTWREMWAEIWAEMWR